MVEDVKPDKREVALKLLESSSLFIHLDPRREGVVIPPWFKNQAQLVLQVGLMMAVPIHDLDVGEEGISCTLSFSRQPHWCFMPWSATYALVGDDGQGMVWPECVPSEVARQSDLQGPPPKPTVRKRAPKIAPLGAEKAEAPAAAAPTTTAKTRAKTKVKPMGPPSLAVLPGGRKDVAVVPPRQTAPLPAVPGAIPPVPERPMALVHPETAGSAGQAPPVGDAQAGGQDHPKPSPAPATKTNPLSSPLASPLANRRERPAWLRVVKGGADQT